MHSEFLSAKHEACDRHRVGMSSPGNDSQSSSRRFRHPSSTGQSFKTADRHRLGSRNQTRRLPNYRPPGWPHSAASSRNACDCTAKLSAIAAAAELIKAKSFTMDGEAVVLGPDGLSRFEELRFPPLVLDPRDLVAILL